MTRLVFSATEDWSGPQGKHTYLCSDDPRDHEAPRKCTSSQQPVFDPKAYDKTISLDWQVRTDGKSSATYTGTLTV